MYIKKPSWPSGEDCRLVGITLKFGSQQDLKDFALNKENLKKFKNAFATTEASDSMSTEFHVQRKKSKNN
jgi:hypothetical protein